MGIYLSASNVVRLLADMFITALLIAPNLSGENKKLVLSKIILHDIPITGQGRVTQCQVVGQTNYTKQGRAPVVTSYPSDDQTPTAHQYTLY